jgi:hypothetical protein
MKFNIFLDDIRQPRDSFKYTKDIRYNKLDWVIVRDYNDFVSKIKEIGLENIEVISLDHDLADEHYFSDTQPWSVEGEIDYFSYQEKTGYDCAKWLCDHALDTNKKIPNVLVHSFNQVGSDNIRYYIKNFIKNNPEQS